MKLKDSTVIVNQNIYTDTIKAIVDRVYKTYGLEATCTSGNDGVHGKNSYHGKDRALDIRFWDILDKVAESIRRNLPPYYDDVVEKDHFHIEADAKKEALWISKTSNTSTADSTGSKTN